MHDIQGRNTTIGEVEFLMFDSIFYKVICVISFVIETDYSRHSKFLEDRDVICGCEGSILSNVGCTPYLSVVLSDGELKAINLLGKIQLRSPFSIFS